MNKRAAATLMSLLVALGLLVAVESASSGANVPSRITVASKHRVVVSAAVRQLSAGGQHGCAVLSTGRLSCWGDGTYGQLDGPSGSARATPVAAGGSTTWTQVSAGGSHTCGVTSSHRVRCWGLNHFGALGNGKTKATSARVKVKKGKHYASVAAGWFQTCGIRLDHSMRCWGDNRAGELGTGDSKRYAKPQRVKGGQGWAQVATGGWNTCGVKLDGSLWCWGGNQWGQLGNGTYTGANHPVRVGVRSDWAQVASTWSHTCAVTRGGETWCWGNNNESQLGNGGRTSSAVPVRVATSARARQVAVGEGTSCLLDTAGRVLCWGYNGYGQIGDRSTLVHPVPVVRSTGVTAISAGWLYTCDLRSGGSVTCYGDNETGQLGNGTVSDTAYPLAPGAVISARSDTDPTTGPTTGPTTDPTPPTTTSALPTPAPSPVPTAPNPTSYTMAPGAPTDFELGTFNILGNQHTTPGTDEDYRAPARLRAEWTAQAIDYLGLDVVATQEAQAQQLAWILKASHGQLASYATPDKGTRWTEAALLWRTSAFTALQTKQVWTPYITQLMPRPLVLLQNRATGRQMWVLAIHNAPWSTKAQQKKRNHAMATQVAKVQNLTAKGYPVFYIGDFNEKSKAFCTVMTKTSLRTPQGGKIGRNGVCKPPHNTRLDWLFGSNGVVWSGYEQTRTPLVANATDHFLQRAHVHLP